jgi:hypothetical protein
MVFCLRSCLSVVLTALLATPTWPSRHGFRTQRPPTSLSLISHSLKSSSLVLVALLIKLVDVPLVDPLRIVHFSSLSYCCAIDEAQHCLDTGLLEQDPQVLSIHSCRSLNLLERTAAVEPGRRHHHPSNLVFRATASLPLAGRVACFNRHMPPGL